MKLSEYLIERLDITEDEAANIVEAVNEYKNRYGKKYVEVSVFNRIVETREYCEQVNFDVSKLHCNGCSNHCSLDNPMCGKGAQTRKDFYNKNYED